MSRCWCENCGSAADDQDGQCPSCRQGITRRAAPVSTLSSLVRATDPKSRRAYLDRLGDQDRPLPEDASNGFLSDLADAELLMEQCDADVAARMSEMAQAEHWITTEHINDREMTPQQRAKYVWAIGARSRWEAARARADKARARYWALADRFSEIATPPTPGSTRARPASWVGPWWRDEQ